MADKEAQLRIDVVHEFAQHVAELSCEKAVVDYRYTVKDPQRKRVVSMQQAPSVDLPMLRKPTQNSTTTTDQTPPLPAATTTTTSTTGASTNGSQTHSGTESANTAASASEETHHPIEDAVANVIRSVTSRQGSLVPIKFRRLPTDTGGERHSEGNGNGQTAPSDTSSSIASTTGLEGTTVSPTTNASGEGATETDQSAAHSVEKLRIRVKMIDGVPHVMVKRPEDSTSHPMPLQTYLETVYQPFVETKKQMMENECMKHEKGNDETTTRLNLEGQLDAASSSPPASSNKKSPTRSERSSQNRTRSTVPSPKNKANSAAPFGSTSSRFGSVGAESNVKARRNRSVQRAKDASRGQHSNTNSTVNKSKKSAVPKQRQSESYSVQKNRTAHPKPKVDKKEYSRIRQNLFSRIDRSQAKQRGRSMGPSSNRYKQGDDVGTVGRQSRSISQEPSKSNAPSDYSAKRRQMNKVSNVKDKRNYLKGSTQNLVRNAVLSRVQKEGKERQEGVQTEEPSHPASHKYISAARPPTPPPPSAKKDLNWKGMHSYKNQGEHPSGYQSHPSSGNIDASTMSKLVEEPTDLNRFALNNSRQAQEEVKVGPKGTGIGRGPRPTEIKSSIHDNRSEYATPITGRALERKNKEKMEELLTKFVEEGCKDVPQRIKQSLRKYSEDSTIDSKDTITPKRSPEGRRHSEPSPYEDYTKHFKGQNRIIFSSALPALPDGQKVQAYLKKANHNH